MSESGGWGEKLYDDLKVGCWQRNCSCCGRSVTSGKQVLKWLEWVEEENPEFLFLKRYLWRVSDDRVLKSMRIFLSQVCGSCVIGTFCRMRIRQVYCLKSWSFWSMMRVSPRCLGGGCRSVCGSVAQWGWLFGQHRNLLRVCYTARKWRLRWDHVSRVCVYAF